MSDPKIDLATEAARAGKYPQRLGKREDKILEAVKQYVDNSAPNNVITTEGDLIVGDASGDAIRLPIGSANLPLVSDGTTASYTALPAAGLASVPSHVIKFAGTFTTLGGDATESITVTGALNTDIVMVSVKTAGVSPESIVAATSASNAITVTMSGDPSTDHVLQYAVMRAAT